tara:strand:+ start:22919 stop:23257 length:339 start_codon:yes stop_codon:yes gene_type:complete
MIVILLVCCVIVVACFFGYKKYKQLVTQLTVLHKRLYTIETVFDGRRQQNQQHQQNHQRHGMHQKPSTINSFAKADTKNNSQTASKENETEDKANAQKDIPSSIDKPQTKED